jgi:hypothetical protein
MARACGAKLVTPTVVTNVSAKVKVKTQMNNTVRVSFKSMRDVLRPRTNWRAGQ